MFSIVFAVLFSVTPSVGRHKQIISSRGAIWYVATAPRRTCLICIRAKCVGARVLSGKSSWTVRVNGGAQRPQAHLVVPCRGEVIAAIFSSPHTT